MKSAISLKLMLLLAFLAILFSPKMQSEETQLTPAILDNSFFVEQAMNQEEGVVQVIQNIVNFSKPEKFTFYTLTNEWPLAGYKHQLSFTLPYAAINNESSIGDLMLNYRYQLFYEEDWLFSSPRLSLILPTGKKSAELGTGNWGAQINVPFSKRLNEPLLVHLNVGATYLFNANKVDEETSLPFNKNTFSGFYGVGIDWITTTYMNIMLEYFHTATNAAPTLNTTAWENEMILCPGARFAFNIGKTQIVPGIAFPIRYKPESNISHVGFWGYFSVEFPVWEAKK